MTSPTPDIAKLRPNPAWAQLPLFGRKGWKTVRFGDVVENLNKTCDPAEAGLERFIGLEHLEPGSLHIRTWGNVADGTTFNRRCRPGHVLFGKRRAYQRKVAVAEFEAVVSGDIYVLAPRGGRLLPELLPFLCLSERFFQHAVGTSAGSLSPRTNWTSLATFEFHLPPLDQQRRIAEILWAVDGVQESRYSLRQKFCELWESSAEYHFGLAEKHKVALGTLVENTLIELQTGPFGTVLATSSYTMTGVPVVNPANMDEGRVDMRAGPFISDKEATRLVRYQMHPGDIVMCRVRHVGEMFYVEPAHDGFIVGTHCIRIRTNESEVLGRYLFLYLRSRRIQQWLVRATVGTVMPAINEATLRKLIVPLPPVAVQQQVIGALDTIQGTVEAIATDHYCIGAVGSACLSEFFADSTLMNR